MKKLSWLFLFLFFVITACDDDDEAIPIVDGPVPVTQVQGPDNMTVGQTAEIEVTFRVRNECGQFERFEEVVSGMTYTITVHAEYIGQACAQVITTRTEGYLFTPTTAGTYTFRFWSGENNQFVTHTIVVQ
ncbi:hypothetical protein DXT99_05220 [Pontibacter diazotrophicus]|uniref:GOLD domain-containing protein n=1 Tax=Pontibacter diazotrophicus TaxID=1400979 RepID=A0A3D8LGN4_9BACT|nr:hypothetical protein [Pontibacter diazotrophicus]RDV16072.1 hypothetical protein DXT99_05220 [Pontibacter diazotrophicus]